MFNKWSKKEDLINIDGTSRKRLSSIASDGFSLCLVLLLCQLSMKKIDWYSFTDWFSASLFPPFFPIRMSRERERRRRRRSSSSRFPFAIVDWKSRSKSKQQQEIKQQTSEADDKERKSERRKSIERELFPSVNPVGIAGLFSRSRYSCAHAGKGEILLFFFSIVSFFVTYFLTKMTTD